MNENFIREEENRNDSPELDNVQKGGYEAVRLARAKTTEAFINEQLLLVQAASRKASPDELTRLSMAMVRLLSWL